MCCSVLQRVAVCCSVLQCVAVCCSVLQRVAVCCRSATDTSSHHMYYNCYSVLQCAAMSTFSFFVTLQVRPALSKTILRKSLISPQKSPISLHKGAILPPKSPISPQKNTTSPQKIERLWVPRDTKPIDKNPTAKIPMETAPNKKIPLHLCKRLRDCEYREIRSQ